LEDSIKEELPRKTKIADLVITFENYCNL